MNSKSKFILNIILLIFIYEASSQELYIGCYKTFSGLFSATTLSVFQCLKECRTRSALLAAIKDGSSCYCGDITNTRVPSSNCNLPCGDNSGTCGGTNYYAVYIGIPVYPGCFRDNDHDRDLANLIYGDDKMTIDKCYGLCYFQNFRYCGVQNSKECFCGQRYGKYASLPEIECGMTCAGDRRQICGGASKNSIYLIGELPALNKNYGHVFHCLFGATDMRGTCIEKVCQPGWKGTKCNQRDSATNNGNCGQHKCEEIRIGNQVISECVCKEGFQSLSVYDDCIDIDECTSRVCDVATSTCENTIGSYKCACKEGFANPPSDLLHCYDIDECQSNPCNVPSETCINTVGSFMCVCSSGYNYTFQHNCMEQCHGHLFKCNNTCNKMEDHVCSDAEVNEQQHQQVNNQQHKQLNDEDYKVTILAVVVAILALVLGVSISALIFYKIKNRKLIAKVAAEQKVSQNSVVKSERNYEQLNIH